MDLHWLCLNYQAAGSNSASGPQERRRLAALYTAEMNKGSRQRLYAIPTGIFISMLNKVVMNRGDIPGSGCISQRGLTVPCVQIEGIVIQAVYAQAVLFGMGIHVQLFLIFYYFYLHIILPHCKSATTFYSMYN